MSIHLQTSRSNSLRSAFIDALDVLKYKNQRRHKLLILSCYIDFDAIERLIRSVREKLPLSEVHLAFEFMEAFRSRLPNETEAHLERVRLQCKKQDIDFQWSPLRAGALMHAKGYAVIQVVNGDEAQGVVCIGSGNATLPGLGIAANGARANVELACISSDEEDVSGFRSAWDHLMGSSRSLEDASRREDDYAFSYALLASGIFLHDWQATLRSHVGISYMLTPEGRKAISVDEELRRLGFDVDTASMNRNPLRETVDFSSARALPPAFAKQYTVDTLLGRWCPRTVWSVVGEVVERDEEFKGFLERFRVATQPDALSRIAIEEEAIASRLVSRNFVTESPERVGRWKEKIETLRDNEDKLWRLFLKYDSFDMPYDYQSRDDVMDLHGSLFDSISMKERRSLVSAKVLDAEEQGDLSLLSLSDDEYERLTKILQGQGDSSS